MSQVELIWEGAKKRKRGKKFYYTIILKCTKKYCFLFKNLLGILFFLRFVLFKGVMYFFMLIFCYIFQRNSHFFHSPDLNCTLLRVGMSVAVTHEHRPGHMRSLSYFPETFV